MKMTFRWYGDSDPVALANIRQIPNMSGVVSSLYHIPPGEVWPVADIAHVKDAANGAGLEFEVVESIPLHEDIRTGSGDRDRYIENYIQSIRNLKQASDVKVICYNFMPVFDWTRTRLDHPLPDGSNALVYYKSQLEKMDPLTGELALPGWDAAHSKAELTQLFDTYKNIDNEALWRNLEYFLKAIVPVAAECDIKMAIHPDDPPWPIFGLPRIITCEENLDRFLKVVDSPYNGLTFCTGSLGCAKSNDVVKMIGKYAAMGRVHFVHARNVLILEDGSFEESAHYSKCGSLDMVGILRALKQNGFDGYIRPDHGRMIWGETGKPGYGLYDRALGAMYLTGLWEAVSKNK